MIKRCTLKDIAKATGLTVNSVSRALHDKNDISAETKQRVAEVAKQLGYVPNYAASSLKNGRGNTVAVVFDNLFNPYYNIMMHYIMHELAAVGYDSLTVIEPGERLSAEMYDKLLSRNVDGVISFLEPDENFAEKSAKGRLPLAVIGRHCDIKGIDFIFSDDKRGGYLAAEYLINKGCKNLRFIADSLNISCARDRREGFIKCVTERGLPYGETIMEGQTYSEAIENILQTNPESDGFVCFNDYIALEAQYVLRKRGRRGISVIGYDNIQCEFKIAEEYATISVDKRNLARAAVEMLLDRIEGRYDGESRVKVLDVELIGE